MSEALPGPIAYTTDTETVSASSAETVTALPGFAPERVAADPSTDQVLSVNSPTEQLVKALMPVGAYRTDDHRYWWNGIGPYPSVTTVLGILDKPAVVTWKAKEAARAVYQLYGGGGQAPHELPIEEEAILWALAEADKQSQF